MCYVLKFTRHLIHLINKFSFHIYVAMHLFDDVDALDILKNEKQKNIFVFFNFANIFQYFPDVSGIIFLEPSTIFSLTQCQQHCLEPNSYSSKSKNPPKTRSST
jgi:hypothetical protein